MALSLQHHLSTFTSLLQAVTPCVERATLLIDPDRLEVDASSLLGIQQKLARFAKGWKLAAKVLDESGWDTKSWEETCIGTDSAGFTHRLLKEQGALIAANARCTAAAVAYLQLASDLTTQTSTHLAVFDQMWALIELPGRLIFCWMFPWHLPHLQSSPQLFAAVDSLLGWLLEFTRGGCSAWAALQHTSFSPAKLRARLAVPIEGALTCLHRVHHAELITTLLPPASPPDCAASSPSRLDRACGKPVGRKR